MASNALCVGYKVYQHNYNIHKHNILLYGKSPKNNLFSLRAHIQAGWINKNGAWALVNLMLFCDINLNLKIFIYQAREIIKNTFHGYAG